MTDNDDAPRHEHPPHEPTAYERVLLAELPATTAQLVERHEAEHHPGDHTGLTMRRYVESSLRRLKMLDLVWPSAVDGEAGWVRGDGRPRTA